MESVIAFVEAISEMKRAGRHLRAASPHIHPATYSKAMELLDQLNDLQETILSEVEAGFGDRKKPSIVGITSNDMASRYLNADKSDPNAYL